LAVAALLSKWQRNQSAFLKDNRLYFIELFSEVVNKTRVSEDQRISYAIPDEKMENKNGNRLYVESGTLAYFPCLPL